MKVYSYKGKENIDFGHLSILVTGCFQKFHLGIVEESTI